MSKCHMRDSDLRVVKEVGGFFSFKLGCNVLILELARESRVGKRTLRYAEIRGGKWPGEIANSDQVPLRHLRTTEDLGEKMVKMSGLMNRDPSYFQHWVDLQIVTIPVFSLKEKKIVHSKAVLVGRHPSGKNPQRLFYDYPLEIKDVEVAVPHAIPCVK